ncbi:MAG: hypothetical protein L3K26_15610 [Candidatus Hydrogenedentes bacterium]|nr:hypothetical protein [Candidatus Hydrogenedentota bacterium]
MQRKQLSRRAFLGAAATGTIAGTSCQTTTRLATRNAPMNVLLLTSDDIPWDSWKAPCPA